MSESATSEPTPVPRTCSHAPARWRCCGRRSTSRVWCRPSRRRKARSICSCSSTTPARCSPSTAMSISAPASAPRSRRSWPKNSTYRSTAVTMVLGHTSRHAEPGRDDRQRQHPGHGRAAAQRRGAGAASSGRARGAGAGDCRSTSSPSPTAWCIRATRRNRRRLLRNAAAGPQRSPDARRRCRD